MINIQLPKQCPEKNPPSNTGDARDMRSIHASGRSPEVRNSNPLQNSCLEIPWTDEPRGLQSKEPDTTEHIHAHMHD